MRRDDNKRPTILEFCLAPNLGGLELYVSRTVKWLSDHKCAPSIIVSKPSRLEMLFSDNSVPFHLLRTIFRPLPLVAAFRLSRYISRHSIDIVHVHWTKDLVLCAFAKIFSNYPVKIVYTRHMDVMGTKHDFYHRFVYGQVDLHLVITNTMADRAKNWIPMPADKIVQLYLGSPTVKQAQESNCFQLQENFGLKSNVFLIGMVGRIEPEKGQHIVVGAIEKLHKIGLRPHVIFIGHAMDAKYLESLKTTVCKSYLENYVHFYGFHPNPPSLMGCFDTLVLATRRETFGLVLIEAMSAGTAVIGTNAGGVPEIIEHKVTGLTYRSMDSQELANCIEQLMLNPDIKLRYANAGKEKARTIFNEDIHYKNLLSQFEALASNNQT